MKTDMNTKQKIGIAAAVLAVVVAIALIAYLRSRSFEDDGGVMRPGTSVNNGTNTVDQGNVTTSVSGESAPAVEVSSTSTAGVKVTNYAPAPAPENVEPIGLGEVSTQSGAPNEGNNAVPQPPITTTTASVIDDSPVDSSTNPPDETDSDADTISDTEEPRYGTDPKKSDTDGDGYSDADEIKNGYNPLGTGRCAVSTCIIK